MGIEGLLAVPLTSESIAACRLLEDRAVPGAPCMPNLALAHCGCDPEAAAAGGGADVCASCADSLEACWADDSAGGGELACAADAVPADPGGAAALALVSAPAPAEDLGCAGACASETALLDP